MVIFLFLILQMMASAQLSCTQIFANKPASPISLEVLFAETPHLQERVKLFLNDGRIPLKFKKLLWDVLKDNDVQIHDFTPSLKREFNFASSMDAFVYDTKVPYKILQRSASNLNDDLFEPVEKLKNEYNFSPQRFVVFINDAPFSPSNHTLLDFIHEIAHVRMTFFLEKNLPHFVGKFPPDFLSVDPISGELLVNSHFINYIQERFAHETELSAYLTLRFYPHMLGNSSGGWWVGYSTSPASRIRLAQRIRSGYGLKDERLAALDHIPLHLIFQQGLPQELWNFDR